MEKTLIKKERILHFPGEVLVKEGESVTPSTVLAKATPALLRPFIIDIALPLHISPNDIKKYMLKKEGDKVKEGDLLAEAKKTFNPKNDNELTFAAAYLSGETIDEVFKTLKVTSPVEGVIEKISTSSGHIVIREIEERDLSPKKVNVAKALNISPKEIKRFMKKTIGQNVEKDGNVAEMPLKAGLILKTCKSPIFGEIKSINEETGEVTIQRPHKSVELLSMLPGKIVKIVPKYGAIIELTGYRMNGIIGFGHEQWGKLEVENNQLLEGKVLVSKTPLSKNEIEKMMKQGLRGLIFSTIQVKEIESIFGEEVYSGTTGKIDKGITIVILDGFGTQNMNREQFNFLSSIKGQNIYLNGTTQIRAGVVRPEIIISE